MRLTADQVRRLEEAREVENTPELDPVALERYRRLWLASVARQVRDYVAGSTYRKANATQYLRSQDFDQACFMCGLSADGIRRSIHLDERELTKRERERLMRRIRFHGTKSRLR